jgi:ubiquinone/menaquinone biosynthesis C-methylase UbiE
VSGNARSRRRVPAARTSWDHLAAWYDGWVGPTGSRYHRALAIPLALELLDLRAGELVLDVGAGQGVLSAHVAASGAQYLGIDASPRMVDVARRRHGRDGRFVLGDAARLSSVPAIRDASFDAAVFLLSIQDMDDLDAVVGAVGSTLRAESRIVVVMTHPAFRQPRHSGWVDDPSGGRPSRRVDAYLRPMAVPLQGRPGAGPTTSFHRPLSAYVTALARSGFAVDALVEVADSVRPEPNPDIPLFLGLRARRLPGRLPERAAARQPARRR